MIKNLKSPKKLFILSGLLSACILGTASTLIPPSINSSAFAQNSRVSKTKTVLYVRPFDGRNLGAVSSRLTLSSGSGRDEWLGWSWDGTTASYIVNE
ncbi:hypothetical protein [Anabaena sp. PCC 7108]|uniref:hypothetical protein n=1 Tax=Anabaena sp. PCC 7108 TaxID=163908 RepID=UPI0003483039|nr:hypothetical protein [Anabaena sp. PCC 7108]